MGSNLLSFGVAHRAVRSAKRASWAEGQLGRFGSQVVLLAKVRGQASGDLELGNGQLLVAGPLEQVRPHRVQPVVGAEALAHAVEYVEAAAGLVGLGGLQRRD
jgi:hypothetical protein